MNHPKEYLTPCAWRTIDETVNALKPDKVLVVSDENVYREVFPKLGKSKVISQSPYMLIPVGEEGKNLNTVVKIWEKLEEIGASRQSLVINIGGGVVTDLGGFAASAFKRGIRTINFPTTLLGAVDAATGGKTGINFGGLKNEIGAFHMPSKVIISALPFSSLSQEEILSGYAEMIKTALIADANLYTRLLDIDSVLDNPDVLGKAVEECVRIKDDVVEQDPHEKGLRKILNFGHTAGHAFESLRMKKGKPVSHGKAVAHGMLVALVLSNIILGFESKFLQTYTRFLKENYGVALIDCKEIEGVMQKMNSDKKNRKYGEPVFTLLKSIGEPVIDITPSQSEIRSALDIYLDLMG